MSGFGEQDKKAHKLRRAQLGIVWAICLSKIREGNVIDSLGLDGGAIQKQNVCTFEISKKEKGIVVTIIIIIVIIIIIISGWHVGVIHFCWVMEGSLNCSFCKILSLFYCCALILLSWLGLMS